MLHADSVQVFGPRVAVVALISPLLLKLNMATCGVGLREVRKDVEHAHTAFEEAMWPLCSVRDVATI